MTAPATRPGIAPLDTSMEWFLSSTPALADGVEPLPGLDGRPMLFSPANGKYVAITPGAVRVTTAFDGQRSGRNLLAALQVAEDTATAQRIARMTHDLRQSGFLTEAPAHEDMKARASRFALREHLPRWELVHNVDRLLEPVVAPLRTVAIRGLVLVWLAFALAGLVIGGYALTHVRVAQMPSHIWVVLPLIFLQIGVHETSHAIVCQYLRAPVRSAGIALMLFFMPVGYVDRTDSHRVSSRTGRVLISLAGPLSDQLWFGVAGIVALTTPPPISHLAVVLLVFQLLMTFMNLNPLTPSDGYHAITASLGFVNLRGKCFATITHAVTRAPLPAYLENTRPAERRAMAVYGVLCLLFALALFAMALLSVTHMIQALS